MTHAAARRGPEIDTAAGATALAGLWRESIDDMRIVTNRGTGETAVALALAAYHEGADTELWMGRCTVPLPAFLRIRRFEAVGDLLEMVKEVDHDLALVPAALSDFTFDRERGKLPSEAKATALQLKSVPKVLPSLKERCPKVIGFKAESGLGEEGLIAEARASLKRYGLAAVAAQMRASSPPWLGEELTRSWTAQWPQLPDALDEAAGYVAPTHAQLATLTVPMGLTAAVDDAVHPLQTASEWAATVPRAALCTVTLDQIGADPTALGTACVTALVQASRA